MSKTIKVSDETWTKIKDQVEADNKSFEVKDLDGFIGQKLFIRTVTYHLVGEVTKRIGHLFEMKNASWVADSGRFMQAIKSGTLNEVEPVGNAWVNLDAVVDMFPWCHALPKEQR
jgi:frataxin-like iron-binding protein CyaY